MSSSPADINLQVHEAVWSKSVVDTIQHAGGSAVVTVSQAQRGGQWNELGVFPFAAGQGYAVTLSGDANGTVVADAVYIVKVEELADAVTWVPALPAADSYQVYAKWTSDETRATDALYRIAHEGGTAAVSVNQRVGSGVSGGGQWHYLGSYAFDPLNGPAVTLAANDNGSVAADALRFVGGPGGATDVAYLHNDHLGTPQAMTDAAAQLLWWRDQTPFGQTVSTGGFSESPLRFPGQYADPESGLAYNYFRDYHPALGRYIQSDPIGLGGGLNTYGYVGGNPLAAIDLYGLETYVIIGHPTRGNPFGHTAVGFPSTNEAYSHGTDNPIPADLDDYLDRQSEYRSSDVYILPTTPEQEACIASCLAGLPEELPSVFDDPLAASRDNCASRTNNCLHQCGIGEPYQSYSRPLGTQQFVRRHATGAFRVERRGK